MSMLNVNGIYTFIYVNASHVEVSTDWTAENKILPVASFFANSYFHLLPKILPKISLTSSTFISYVMYFNVCTVFDV